MIIARLSGPGDLWFTLWVFRSRSCEAEASSRTSFHSPRTVRSHQVGSKFRWCKCRISAQLSEIRPPSNRDGHRSMRRQRACTAGSPDLLLIYRKPDITNLQPVRPSPIVSAAFTPHSVRQVDVFQPITLMSGPAIGEHPHAPPIPPVVLV